MTDLYCVRQKPTQLCKVIISQLKKQIDIGTRLWTWMEEKKKRVRRNGEKSREADTLLYVKQIANGNVLPDLGNSNQGSVTTQRDGKGWELEGRFRREGTYVYLWLIHVDVWQKPKQYCKAIILQLKIFFFKKSDF